MNSSESAEAIVKMMLEGTEVVAKITGEGAKQLAIMLYTMSKDKKQTKGRTKLNNMLKSGISQKIFSIRKDQLKDFHKEAKRYGILYTTIANKKIAKDGMVDLFVRAEDAPKVNHIIKKFKLEALDIATIKSEIEKEKMDKMLKEANEKGIEVKSEEERIADDLLTKPLNKEKNQMENPNVAKIEKSPLSEHLLENKKNIGVATKKKKSIRALIREITEEMRTRNEEKEKVKTEEKVEVVKRKESNEQSTNHQHPINKKKRNKGKGR